MTTYIKGDNNLKERISMKKTEAKKSKRKIVVASALVAGAVVSGIAGYAASRPVSALEEGISGQESAANEQSDVENQNSSETQKGVRGGETGKKRERKGKPEGLTDEEWEQKKAELKEKM